MNDPGFKSALIVGAGEGLSAALARGFAASGMAVTLAARRIDKLAALCAQTGAHAVACDATQRSDVERLFAGVDARSGPPDVVVYNASYRVRGPFVDLDATEVERTLMVCAMGGFLIAQAAARRMVPRRHGAILLTGASASTKGYAQSAPFAMGKFALRGLAQSLTRELAPQGIHVAHFVIDGGIRSAQRTEPHTAPDSLLAPEAIAASYLHVLRQPRNAWTWEIELRPWVERF